MRGGDHTLSEAQRAVRAAFYLWLGAANLVRPLTLEPWLHCCCAVLHTWGLVAANMGQLFTLSAVAMTSVGCTRQQF